MEQSRESRNAQKYTAEQSENGAFVCACGGSNGKS